MDIVEIDGWSLKKLKDVCIHEYVQWVLNVLRSKGLLICYRPADSFLIYQHWLFLCAVCEMHNASCDDCLGVPGAKVSVLQITSSVIVEVIVL